MPYQALAIKYRPQSFDKAIGQDAMCTTLKNAITKKRIHHAYLFCGPRGIGKTSLARIFAKSLNCEGGPCITPCQKCNPCIEITASRSLDVQEIDGASNTSVDDIRRLRESVKYTPSSGRYKIYIIDEVHMLSKSAFAALLKTLEEPPAHVIFLFATTDPQKMPATIISRVLRFDLRRPSKGLLVKHLQEIASEEGIAIDAKGLESIAHQAEGSIRDALSLLDRVIAYAGKEINVEQVREALGITGTQTVFELLTLIIERDTEKTLQKVQDIYEGGHDLLQLTIDLIEATRDALYFKVTQDKATLIDADLIAHVVEKTNVSNLEFIFRVLHQSYHDLAQSPLPKVHFEISMIRLCTRAEREDIAEVLYRLQGTEEKGAKTQAATPSTLPHPTREKKQGSQSNDWAGFLRYVEEKKPSMHAIMGQVKCREIEGKSVEVAYPDNVLYKKMLEEPDRKKIVMDLFNEYFKKEVRFVDADATVTINKDQKKAATLEEAIAILKPKQTQRAERGQF
jgi:DNA polymerase III subunit gamma/tau